MRSNNEQEADSVVPLAGSGPRCRSRQSRRPSADARSDRAEMVRQRHRLLRLPDGPEPEAEDLSDPCADSRRSHDPEEELEAHSSVWRGPALPGRAGGDSAEQTGDQGCAWPLARRQARLRGGERGADCNRHSPGQSVQQDRHRSECGQRDSGLMVRSQADRGQGDRVRRAGQEGGALPGDACRRLSLLAAAGSQAGRSRGFHHHAHLSDVEP